MCAKKRNWKYIKILLGTRKRREDVCLIAQNPGFELRYSVGGPLEPAGSSTACCQGWGQEGPLLPGPGATISMPKWLHILTKMPTLLGSLPRSPVLAGELDRLQFLLDASVLAWHYLENWAMHLPKRHLGTAVTCGVNRGVIGGELTEESVGLGKAVLRGFGEKFWGKKRCPLVNPHFTSHSHLVRWCLGLCTAHHSQKSCTRLGSGVLHQCYLLSCSKSGKNKKEQEQPPEQGRAEIPSAPMARWKAANQ